MSDTSEANRVAMYRQSPHQYFRPPLPRPPPGGPPVQRQQQQHRAVLPAHQQQQPPREEPQLAHPHAPHQWAPVPPSLQAHTMSATEWQPQPAQQRAPGPLNPGGSEPGRLHRAAAWMQDTGHICEQKRLVCFDWSPAEPQVMPAGGDHWILASNAEGLGQEGWHVCLEDGANKSFFVQGCSRLSHWMSKRLRRS